jgi:hypothetical protein
VRAACQQTYERLHAHRQLNELALLSFFGLNIFPRSPSQTAWVLAVLGSRKIAAAPKLD